MTGPTAAAARRELARLADPERAAFMRRFMRAEKGGYGEGDRFRGIPVPRIRQAARRFRQLPLPELARLLRSAYHEDRMLALVVLVHRAQRADETERRRLRGFFLQHKAGVNNWDLVDVSAPWLLGWDLEEIRPTLDRLSRSKDVWDRRVAVLAHMLELRDGKVDAYLAFAPRFLDDEHDLIHKAVGWLLREAGQRDPERLLAFLQERAAKMPRTMLRYAIEKLPPAQRKRVLRA